MIANRIAAIITTADRLMNPCHYRLTTLWKDLGSPHRPNKEEIGIYKKFLGAIDSKDRILILGATPELRDIILGAGAKSFVADYSLQMLISMESLMDENPRFRETWIKGDWLDIDFRENFFMAVLGDLSLRHLDPAAQYALLEKICRWTKPEGKIILRLHFVNRRFIGRSYADILNDARVLKLDGSFGSMNTLLSWLYDTSTSNERIDYRGIERGINEYLTQKNIPFSYRVFLHEFLAKRVSPYSKPLASSTKEFYETILAKFCSKGDSECVKNYAESEHYPIYSLIPKK